MNRISNITKCDKTLQLIRKSLTAGYKSPITNSIIKSTEGTPQGSVLSPLLANIVLDELDKQVESMKVQFDKGTKRRRNKLYSTLQSKIQSLQT